MSTGNWQARTEMLLGPEGVAALSQKRVAVFGLGGVGGHACEALARAGVGALDLFDDDVVAESNLNRQAVALRSTIGMPKTTVMAARIADINPDCRVTEHRVFYTLDTAGDYPFDGYDYVVDAVDTVSAKLEIIARAKAAGVPVVSAMGTGNKLHPECLKLVDISQTDTCPLARVMRKELRKRGIAGVPVVCSDEEPLRPAPNGGEAAIDEAQACASPAPEGRDGRGASQPSRPGRPKTNTPGSVSFVPAAAGMILAGAVVRGLLGLE